MVNMSIYWMETAIKSLPDDKSQITFLFDRTGIVRTVNVLTVKHRYHVISILCVSSCGTYAHICTPHIVLPLHHSVTIF